MICTTLIPLFVVCWTVSPSSNGKNLGGLLPTNSDIGAWVSLANSRYKWGIWCLKVELSSPDKPQQGFYRPQHRSLFKSGSSSDGVPVKVPCLRCREGRSSRRPEDTGDERVSQRRKIGGFHAGIGSRTRLQRLHELGVKRRCLRTECLIALTVGGEQRRNRR